MSKAAEGVLKHYLQQLQVAGKSHVGVRPGTLERLRRRGQPAAARPVSTPRPVTAEPEAFPPPAPAARTPSITTAPPSSFTRTAEPAAPVLSIQVTDLPGDTKAEKLAALAKMAEASPEARALGTLRGTMVFAVGTPEAQIMFVGEAPGAEEERQQEPFVGPAGQKLTGIITAMGLKRSDVYISNICKFRPAMENQGFSNRAPTAAEMSACLAYILAEIAIIRPQVIVALGATAATGLGLKGPVSKLRGQFYEVQGIPTMVTFHPSYILREEKLAGGGLQAKRQVWEDMLQVMAKTGLPISEKQKGYFRK